MGLGYKGIGMMDGKMTLPGGVSHQVFKFGYSTIALSILWWMSVGTILFYLIALCAIVVASHGSVMEVPVEATFAEPV